MSIYFIVILAYLLLLAGMSVYKSFQVKDQSDTMVAGRKLPAWMLVGTLLCTWIGSGSIIAGAGLAYMVGFSEIWMSAGAWAAIILVYFLAGPARSLAQFTVQVFLEKRYGKWARILGTLTVITAYLTIVGYQFKAGGMILELVADVPREYGIPLTAIFVIVITSFAGMLSVVTADIFNGIIIILGIVISVPLMLLNLGGIGNLTASLPADRFTVFGQNDFFWALGVFFPTFFLLLGESNMYQKFFSARDEKAARNSVIGWVVGTIVIETLICALAVIGSALFPDLKDKETVILHSARHGLPLWAGCLLLSASVAIIVSTANSFLLTPSINITRDIYQRFIVQDASQKKIILFQRGATVVFGLLAFLLLTQFKTVLDMAFTDYP
ncbi:MAG: sodium:solute symporter family protein, partial [Deltaproteobacteria bacterium]|nr:sodium:solute symporter family protein [Deltaproteobacteria bacterium]